MTRLPAKTLSSLSSRLLAPALAVLLSACSVVDRAPAPKLEAGARWVVLPFANATETPFAGQRAVAQGHHDRPRWWCWPAGSGWPGRA